MLKVAICEDFREEGWPSMDRVADALVRELARSCAGEIEAALVAPAFHRRASRVWAGRSAANIDRGLNRLWDYPHHVRTLASRYDVFHIVDHSYAQLVHVLPAERTIVTCHDLDTFRSLFDPERERRSEPFKAMMRHVLNGLRAAACVTCDTRAVADELAARALVPSERIVVVPIGVDEAFSPVADADADREAARLTGSAGDAIDVLHVGSTVARKRIDVVLEAVAAARAAGLPVRLVRAGGPFTSEQQALVERLHLSSAIAVLPPLDDRLLAAVYRRAAIALLPSEREGFGLPVVEAMACGTPVIASDIPVLREVGGGAVEHCPPGDADAWGARLVALLRERRERPAEWRARRERGAAAARRYSWRDFAATAAGLYARLSGSLCRV